MLWVLAAAVGVAQTEAEARFDRMVTLYDELCLKTFPDDRAADALMATKDARPLTPEEIRVTLRNDTGRGWLLRDGERTVQVMIEAPPFHACSVRWSMPEATRPDPARYLAATAAFKASRPGFAPVAPQERNLAGFRIRAQGEQRELPGNRAETLLVFEQRVIDPVRRASGEMMADLRFVHQIIVLPPAGAPPSSPPNAPAAAPSAAPQGAPPQR